MIPALLALLAIVDAAFAGFRAAAGRDARIFKYAYYKRALLRGAGAGTGLVLALAAATGVALLVTPAPAALYAELLEIGARMLQVFLGYALLVLAALALYGTARLELRILATVSILGPFTLLRPLVVVGATSWGVALGASPIAAALTVGSSASVLVLGRILDWHQGRLAHPRLTTE